MVVKEHNITLNYKSNIAIPSTFQYRRNKIKSDPVIPHKILPEYFPTLVHLYLNEIEAYSFRNTTLKFRYNVRFHVNSMLL